MEYYEDSFIEFEDYLIQKGHHNISTPDQPHANSDFYLDKFTKYEKWMKAECKREWRKYVKSQENKQKRSVAKCASSDRKSQKVCIMYTQK